MSANPEFLPVELPRGKPIAKNTYGLAVMVSGRTRSWGQEVARSEPKWLVVQCEGKDGKLHRKVFPIPEGRGPRTMTVEIP